MGAWVAGERDVIVTADNHRFKLGECIVLTHLNYENIGGGPPADLIAGLPKSIKCYVASGPVPMTARTFQIAATKDGSHFNIPLGLSGHVRRFSAGVSPHPSGAHR